MKLRDYLHFNRIHASQLARMAEISPTYMRHISNGRIIPSKKIAKRIELLTGGEVTMDEIMGGKTSNEEDFNE